MRQIIYYIILYCLFVNNVQAQQDAQFSQYIFNGIYINPAFAGYKEQLNMHAFYRKQWVNFPGAPQTISFALDGITNDKKVGLALQAVNDQIGAANSTSVYLNYAYRIAINPELNRILTFGLGGGICQTAVDINKISTVTANDPTIQSLTRSKLLPDARFGVLYTSDRFYVGASADRLITNFWLSDNQKDYLNFNLHWYFTSGFLLNISEEYKWKPSLLFKDDIQGPTSVDINSFFLIKDLFWIGGSYRTSASIYKKYSLQNDLAKRSSIIGMVDLFINDKLRVGYAYDYSINATSLGNYPTHEFSIGYFFVSPDKTMLSPRYF